MTDLLIGFAILIGLLLIVWLIPYLVYRLINIVLCRFTKVTAILIFLFGVLLLLGDIYGLYQSLLHLYLPDMPLPNGIGWRNHTHSEARHFLLISFIPLTLFTIGIFSYAVKLFFNRPVSPSK